MATPQIVALPRLRLVCRTLTSDIDDPDLVIAEAGALLSWARQHGRASAPWLVVDGERVEVAAPAPDGIALPDGTGERVLAPGRYAALECETSAPSGVKAGASTLRTKISEPMQESAAPVFARITADGAIVHLLIREPH